LVMRRTRCSLVRHGPHSVSTQWTQRLIVAYGQGYAMGLEDAAALATLLPLGTQIESEDIPKRLELFEKIRKPRVEWLSKISADRADLTKRKENGKFLRSWYMSRTDYQYIQSWLPLTTTSLDMMLLRSSVLRWSR
jgi:2-polyprenyl-6-methoxyphenol hydroxylase-like FAD-dependent oxidoreductase